MNPQLLCFGEALTDLVTTGRDGLFRGLAVLLRPAKEPAQRRIANALRID